MWEIDNLSQLLGFLYSAVFGLICCLAYDILRAFRAQVRCSAAAVFVHDILFSCCCAVACFCFILSVTGGELRAFVLIGAAAGFVLARITVSRFFLLVFSRAVRAVRFVYTKISALSARFSGLLGSVFNPLGKKVRKICGIFINTLKKHLKKK